MSAGADQLLKLRHLVYSKIEKMEAEQKEFHEFLRAIRRVNRR
jgi:hypothetical protein